jgi:hypothetical protein
MKDKGGKKKRENEVQRERKCNKGKKISQRV